MYIQKSRNDGNLQKASNYSWDILICQKVLGVMTAVIDIVKASYFVVVRHRELLFVLHRQWETCQLKTQTSKKFNHSLVSNCTLPVNNVAKIQIKSDSSETHPSCSFPSLFFTSLVLPPRPPPRHVREDCLWKWQAEGFCEHLPVQLRPSPTTHLQGGAAGAAAVRRS